MNVFPSGLSDVALAQLVAGIRRPEGTVNLKATYPGVHDPSLADGVLMNLVAGAHIFRLRRTMNATRIVADHASPGTGTRTAELDLTQFAASNQLDVWLAWAPDEFKLMVPVPPNGPLVVATGVAAEFDLWVDNSGSVIEVGSPGVQVMGATVYVSGAELVSPPARRSWSDTTGACRLLLDSTQARGTDYLLGVIASNATLSMAVTGLEVYLAKRFAEVEAEGIAPDLAELLRTVGTREERDELASGTTPAVLAQAEAFDELRDRVSFQSYDRAKRAWKAAYGIRFGADLGLTSLELERIQRLLHYRHRVVHVSPLIGLLNQPTVPPDEPEFAGVEFTRSALDSFERFVQALHEATMRLRPASS